MEKGKKITVYDIAQLAGVSVATVSRVINNSPNVDFSTRKKVLDLCRTNKYYPVEKKKDKGGTPNFNIGIVINQMADPAASLSDYVLDILQGALEFCQTRSATLSILTVDQAAQSYPELFIQKLLARGIDGVVFINPGVNAPCVEALGELDYPCICLGSFFSNPKISSINIDNSAGIGLAVNHLRGKGIRRIGYVTVRILDFDAVERSDAFQAYMDVDYNPADVVQIKPDGGDHKKTTFAYFDRRLPQMPGNLPEAYVCLNDNVAIGLIAALRKHGVSVPGQVKVVGYDDYAVSQYYNPSLTTVRNPMLRMGEMACGNIIDALEGNRSAVRRLIIPTLVERESTASGKLK